MIPPDAVVDVERMVPGGYGLARVEGRVVLIRGAIPGERVRVALETTGKGGVVFGDVSEILEASDDRVTPESDPSCGGLALAHVAYGRQLTLKAEMLGDALRRTARLPDVPLVDVLPSPATGWRMRARVHVDGRRIGFFRQGTHDICSPSASQLPASMRDAAEATLAWLPPEVRATTSELTLAEDVQATRAAVLVGAGRPLPADLPWPTGSPAGVSGVALTTPRLRRAVDVTGDPALASPLRSLGVAGAKDGLDLRWHPATFFQANRAIVPRLVARVVDAVEGREVVDLFAGVGLFGVCAAAAGAATVTCVEGDDAATPWLEQNAATIARETGVHVTARHAAIETALAQTPDLLDGRLVIVDPPRTGLPTRVCARLAASRAARVVYVSCDAPTFARDLRRLLDGGFVLRALEAFDMFPQTAHLETLAVLERP